MSNKLMLAGAILALIIGGWMIFRNPGKIPLLNLKHEILAESPLDARCAGIIFVKSRAKGDKQAAADCRERRQDELSSARDLKAVQFEFCRGVIEGGFDISQYDCTSYMTSTRTWPVRKGKITALWSDRFPYPGDLILQSKDMSGGRTGDRPPIEREGNTR